MNKKEIELKRVLEIEDPILFLGAGFSLGGKTNQNHPIPNGSQLKEILITQLLKYPIDSENYNDLIKFSLSDVSDFCESEKSKAHLEDFLIEIFKNTEPSEHQKLITKFPWKKIYTTNIDDIIETSYQISKKSLLVQNFKRKSTLDNKGKTELYKLHGCVNNPSEGFTFSSRSYLDSMILNKDYRFNSLSLDMHSESIIFLGHDFNEINIDFYLKLYENSGYQSSKGSLIFINPSPSIILKSKIKKLGATLIEWKTEEFFDFVLRVQENKDSSQTIKQKRTLSRFRFKNLNDLKSQIFPIENYESELYFGYEPTWKDIFDEWDFENSEINNSLKHFDNALKDLQSGLIALYGKGLSGKSSYLLRLGQKLDMEGFEVWSYEGKYFNYFEFFKWIKLNKEQKYFCLLIDDAAHMYKDITRLINLIPNDQRLIVITTSRIPLHIRLRYSIIDFPHIEKFLEPNISKEFATEIERTLDQKGYLGSLKSKNQAERIKYISENNDVLSLLYEITYGKEFRNRLNKELKPLLLQSSSEHDLLSLLAIFEKLDIPTVPKELISLQYGGDSKKVLGEIENFIKYTSNGDISLRSGFYLKSIFESIPKDKIIEILKAILKSISPQLDNRPGNLWNHIEASCIKQKVLRKKLKLSSTQIRNMLYDLKEDLGISFNYWIQLGITEQNSKSFDKALNHFRQAEAIAPSSYMIQNAIGRNFLKQANNMDNKSLALATFEEGEEILLTLINNREEYQVKAFSTHTYLYEKINFLKKFKIKPTNRELKELFKLLKQLIDKDPDDAMSKELSNKFLRYLKSIKKENIMKIGYHDLKMLKSMFSDSEIDFEDVLE